MFILSHAVTWYQVTAVLLAVIINHPFLAFWLGSNVALVYTVWGNDDGR
jgi:hypothetical protein